MPVAQRHVPPTPVVEVGDELRPRYICSLAQSRCSIAWVRWLKTQ